MTVNEAIKELEGLARRGDGGLKLFTRSGQGLLEATDIVYETSGQEGGERAVVLAVPLSEPQALRIE